MNDKCWVCEGIEPVFFGKRCEEHDICDVCGTKRAEINGVPWDTRTGFRCQECEGKRIKKAVSNFEKEEHGYLDFAYNDKVKCPYCGCEYTPDELYDSTDDEECPNCSNIMKVEIEWSATYSTSKPNQPLNAGAKDSAG